jgi:hypothetical protein
MDHPVTERAGVSERPARKVPGLAIVGPDTLPPTLPDATGSHVQVWRDAEGEICAYAYTAAGRHWMHLPAVATFCSSATADEVLAIAPPGADADVIRDAYRRAVMPLMLQARGTEALHASAVATPGGVVAFCAASRTGKSTLAYALSRRGYPLWSDDAVAFEACDQGITCIPLPFRLRLRPDAASFLGGDGVGRERVSNADEPRGDGNPAPLAALCTLTRGGAGAVVEIERLSSHQALSALLGNAYCFSLDDPGRKRRMMERYLDVARLVPVFEIRFAPGLDRLATMLVRVERIINGLLTELPG